jgi:hypothetical protein
MGMAGFIHKVRRWNFSTSWGRGIKMEFANEPLKIMKDLERRGWRRI